MRKSTSGQVMVMRRWMPPHTSANCSTLCPFDGKVESDVPELINAMTSLFSKLTGNRRNDRRRSKFNAGLSLNKEYLTKKIKGGTSHYEGINTV
jgi:hypothetical protein